MHNLNASIVYNDIVGKDFKLRKCRTRKSCCTNVVRIRLCECSVEIFITHYTFTTCNLQAITFQSSNFIIIEHLNPRNLLSSSNDITINTLHPHNLQYALYTNKKPNFQVCAVLIFRTNICDYIKCNSARKFRTNICVYIKSIYCLK